MKVLNGERKSKKIGFYEPEMGTCYQSHFNAIIAGLLTLSIANTILLLLVNASF